MKEKVSFPIQVCQHEPPWPIGGRDEKIRLLFLLAGVYISLKDLFFANPASVDAIPDEKRGHRAPFLPPRLLHPGDGSRRRLGEFLFA